MRLHQLKRIVDKNINWSEQSKMILKDTQSFKELIDQLKIFLGMSRPDAAFALNEIKRTTREVYWIVKEYC